MARKGKQPEQKIEKGKNPALNLSLPPLSGKANGYIILFFFIWAAILYGNTILNQYAVDDSFVTQNDLVRKGLAAIPEIFTTHYVSEEGNISDNASDYRPVVKLTYALEYALYQQDKPGRSHALNVLLYFCLSTLLFFILKRLFNQFNLLFPFLITVVFMAHPVHTEVVASLKNRDELLAFLAGLGTMWFLLKYADKGNAWYILPGLLVFLLGYLSKPSILPFLLIYPLVFYFFTNLSPKKYLPVTVAIIVIAVLAQLGPKLFLPEGERLTSMMENPLFVEKGLMYRIGTGLLGLLFYLRILIYPHPLLFYYGYDMIPLVTPANIWALLSLILYAGMLIWALLHLRRKHVLSFAALWYLIFIAMYSNFVIPMVGIVAERFVFAASLGFCIALVYLIFKLFKTEPNSLTIEIDARAKILVVIVLILIPYAALTISRNREWRNLYDLYRKDIPYLENSAKANTQYAGYLMQTTYKDPNFRKYGNVNEYKLYTIKKHFLRSLEIYPNNYQTLNDLGSVYLVFGKDPDSAVIFLRKAIDLNSQLQPAWVNLGMAYRELEKYDSAAQCYSMILRRDPSNIRAYFALANVYNDMGEINKAIAMNQDVLKQYPGMDVPYINIGNYMLDAGDTLMAIQNYEAAMQRRPTFEGATHLSNLYKGLGNKEREEFFKDLANRTLQQSR